MTVVICEKCGNKILGWVPERILNERIADLEAELAGARKTIEDQAHYRENAEDDRDWWGAEAKKVGAEVERLRAEHEEWMNYFSEHGWPDEKAEKESAEWRELYNRAEAELAKVRQHFTVCPEHEFILRAENAEAELSALRELQGRGHEDTCQYLRRAEKAEAAVERLKAFMESVNELAFTFQDDPDRGIKDLVYICRKFKEGGERESGDRYGTIRGSTDAQYEKTPIAAAKPRAAERPAEAAAPMDSECFFCRAGLEQPHGLGCPAARKEA